MTYRPRAGTLAAKLLAHFQQHPDASLTVKDITERFMALGDCRNVHEQLMLACDFELLEWHERKGKDGVYRLGSQTVAPIPEDPPLKPNRPPEAPTGAAELCKVLPFQRPRRTDTPTMPHAAEQTFAGGAMVLDAVTRFGRGSQKPSAIRLFGAVYQGTAVALQLQEHDRTTQYLVGVIGMLCDVVAAGGVVPPALLRPAPGLRLASNEAGPAVEYLPADDTEGGGL